MEPRRMKLSFDMTDPRQAAVAEYLDRAGRKKSKLVTEIIYEYLKQQKDLICLKQEVIHEILTDEHFQKQLRQLRETTITSEKVPRSNPEKDDGGIDEDLLFRGLAMFDE